MTVYGLQNKKLAAILWILTDGDRAKAEDLWESIKDQETPTWESAWDLIADSLQTLNFNVAEDEAID